MRDSFGYRAWLQPAAAPLSVTVKLVGHPGFALEELRSGLAALLQVPPSPEGEYA